MWLPFRGYREAVVVPEFVILTQAFPYAREARLHGERHEDLSLEFVGGLSYGQDRIVPQAVEVLPVAAYHLRTRVFGQYVLRIELFAPLGTDTVARGLPLRYAGKGRHQGGSGQENVFLHVSVIIRLIYRFKQYKFKSSCRENSPHPCTKSMFDTP